MVEGRVRLSVRRNGSTMSMRARSSNTGASRSKVRRQLPKGMPRVNYTLGTAVSGRGRDGPTKDVLAPPHACRRTHMAPP